MIILVHMTPELQIQRYVRKLSYSLNMYCIILYKIYLYDMDYDSYQTFLKIEWNQNFN